MATAPCKGLWERQSRQVPRKQKTIRGGQLVFSATLPKNFTKTFIIIVAMLPAHFLGAKCHSKSLIYVDSYKLCI